MIVLESALALWLGLGVVLAAYGFATEETDGFGVFGRAGLFVSVVLLWPFSFLPEREEVGRPPGLRIKRYCGGHDPDGERRRAA